MFLRKYWVPIMVFIVVIAGICLYMLTTQPPKAPITIIKPVEIEKPTAEETPKVGDTSDGGHFHSDGTFHAQPHDPTTAPTAQNTAPPGAATQPDFPPVDPNEDPVEAAYKRLEYIKNNPYAWGGVHSERATELLAQLLPASYPIDHADSEARELQIEELCEQGDPRAAEALIAIMCDGGTMGRVMFDTLEEIGPPAVPYILSYLQREVTYGSDWIVVSMPVFDSLSRIGVRYRADLGGILDHIIIPKFEEIAADEDHERYSKVTVMDAREALSRLGR